MEWVAVITTALLALMLIGGTVVGWLLGRDPPAWLTGFDGMVVVGAFASGAFFAQARAAAPTAVALADSRAKHHELATMAMSHLLSAGATTIPTPTDGGTTEIHIKGGQSSGSEPAAGQ